MSFVAVVIVSICFKRDCFVRTVTVWAVGLPRLLRTSDDKTCMRNRLLSAASGTQQQQPSSGGRGRARHGQASGRWPWNPIPLRLAEWWSKMTGSWNRVNSLLCVHTRSGLYSIAVPQLLRCRDNWLLCNDYLPPTVITITGYFRDPITW